MIHSSCRALIALTLSLIVITVCQPAFAAKGAKPAGTKMDMKYEGGSLDLKQHNDVDVYVANDKLTLMQHKKTFEIPVSSITEIYSGPRNSDQAIG